jgi:carboxyl-terminal processing protease
VEEFNKSTQGEFSGVGIQIQLDDDGSLKVVSPLEDTPAYRSGVKAGDIITRINGKSAHGITINQAVKTITGVEGTNVTLTIRSQTKDGPLERDYVIRREKIKVASVKGWQHLPGGGWEYFVDPDQKIGYLRITNFTKSTGEELSKAVEEMKNHDAKAIIMDLRYNPGGLLTAATDVADKFLSEGTIVSTKTDPSRDSPVQAPLEAHRSDDDCNLPLVVLVNQYSASASEIVSGALKDWNRALIVGERTFGKGSVQMLFPLKDRSAYLKLTTSHYYLPGGRCIHREENSTTWGVDPDVTVEMTPEQMRAAIDARQELDILRDAGAVAPATTQPNKDLMSVDPQLSAAVLLLRMQLNGATL